jgi:hypothetical protein
MALISNRKIAKGGVTPAASNGQFMQYDSLSNTLSVLQLCESPSEAVLKGQRSDPTG